MTTGRSSLLHSTVMLTGVGIVAQLMGFLYRAALSRLVSAETIGLYQLVIPFYAVVQSVCISGLATTMSVLSSEYHTQGNLRAVDQLVRTGLRAMFFLWLALAVITVVCSGWISGRLLGDSRTESGLLLLLPVLVLTGVENLQKQHFYGIGAEKIPASVELCEQVLRTVAILGLLLLFLPKSQDVTVALMVLGMLLSEMFSSAVLTVIRLRRQKKCPSGAGVPCRQLWRRMGSIALPVSFNALLGNLIGAANTVLIPQGLVAGGMGESQALSHFGVMTGMTLPLLTVSSAFVNALSLALMPRLTRYQADGRMDQCRDKIQKSLMSVSLCVLPVTALIVILGPDLGALLFGDLRVGCHILPLGAGVVLSSYRAILSCTLNALGKQNQAAGISLLCGLIHLMFTWAGTRIPGVGLSAFAAGMVCSEGVGLILSLFFTVQATKMRLRFFSCFSAPGLGALLAGLWCSLFYRWQLDTGIGFRQALLPAAGIGLLLYFTSLHIQGVRLKEYFRSG